MKCLIPSYRTFAVILASISTAAFAEPVMENHSQADINPNAPIVALNTLTSLKNSQPLTVNLPKIAHFTTANGVPVAFVKADNLPIVDIGIYFNAGSARDEAIKTGGFGLANLTANLLTQGTVRHTPEAFTTAVEQLGVELDANAYRDMFSVNLRSLSDPKYLNPAVTLMGEMISTPRFDRQSLQRTQAQLLSRLRQAQEDPDTIASKAFYQTLYGSHPYAHPIDGTLESLPTLTPADLHAFAKRFLVAKNANIAITGNLTLPQAKALANQLTQALPIGTPAPALPDAKPLPHAKTVHIPFDSQQTTVIMGQLGAKRGQATASLDKQTQFAIANDIVGGGNFQARLMADIRKKRGLTYGIYSNMTPMLSQGSYTINFSTRNDKAPEAIQATLDVVKDTVNHGVSQSELDLTKDSMTASFPLGLASNSAINGTLGMMGFYRLPDSYLSEYVTRIQHATLHTVNQSYRQLINPNNFLIVTVGKSPDPKTAPTQTTP